jgi:prolipoprotein diacylglyceryltransferase
MIGIFLTRFFIEFLKERQVDFEMGMALDMGQLLSLPFILLGVAMIVRAMIRPEVTDIEAVVAHANSEYKREDKKRSKKR